MYITGLTLGTDGIAHKLEFHTDRVEKKIAWPQSKRLKPGTLVALTPTEPLPEIFHHRCLVGIVAARPLIDVEAPTPSIDVYFTDAAAMDIDPQLEYMMVEASNGYFEAVRHTLLALQHMRHEKFPLAEYLVDCETEVDSPASLRENPYVDIAPALIGEFSRTIDAVGGWPEAQHIDHSKTPEPTSMPSQTSLPRTSLDQSQFEALRRILTKRLAIIQGPPGTGKTHVSVVALQILLANRKHGDPPIVVTAQTNHALDQLLRHIAPHAPDFIRLGGQTQDEEVIKPRTLFSVKQEQKNAHRELQKARGASYRAYQDIAKRLREVLAPLISTEPIEPKYFLQEGLITKSQHDSLLDAKANWVGAIGEGADSPIGRWTCGDVKPFKKKEPERDLTCIALEDDDEDLYQKKDIELETGAVDDDKDTLYGEKIAFSEGYAAGWSLADAKIEALLRKHNDLDNVPVQRRPPVYNYLQRKLKEKLLVKFRSITAQAKAAAKKVKIARSQLDAAFIREAPVIGLTTTGLSKYRGLVASLCPKIVLIEEAAETQEAYVTAACFETLERLILVGDHLQLQAHCQNQAMEKWNLHISLFERLVHYRRVEYQQLTTQRRMLPEMREVMNVIYPELADHPCVNGRDDVPGMKGVNSWFMSHQTTETPDEQFSWTNQEEAELVAGLFDYLIRNGTPSKDITILTFYKGQQRKLRQLLRGRIAPDAGKIHISTVDAYQGEENEIIILSLVRNNERGNIGFLSVVNRVCVAMSRARRGFYIFGNAQLLVSKNKKWEKMLKLMLKRKRCGSFIPITCTNHNKVVKIKTSAQWLHCDGGCDALCRERLVCGHECPSFCHPESHEDLTCLHPCIRALPCGHACSERCCDTCACPTCADKAAEFRRKRLEPPAGDGFHGDYSTTDAPRAAPNTEPAKISDDANDHEGEVFIGTGPGNAWESQKRHGPSLISLQSQKSDLVQLQGDPSLEPDISKTVLNGASTPWVGRPVEDEWKAGPVKQNKDAKARAQDSQAKIKAYQEFAKGGVVSDDRRRADESAQAAIQVAQKLKDLGNNGGLRFGGAVPMQMTSRVVKDVSPPKQTPYPGPSDQNSPLGSRSGSGSASRASPNAQLPFRPPPAHAADPFIKERPSRFDPPKPDTQDAWASELSGIGTNDIHTPDHQQRKLFSIESDKAQGVRNNRQAQNAPGDGDFGEQMHQDRDSSPQAGVRKKFMYTFTPQLHFTSTPDADKAATAHDSSYKAKTDKVLHAGEANVQKDAGAESTKGGNSSKTAGGDQIPYLIDLS